MRVPNEAHLAHPWRIHEVVPDFTLEDVWAVPEVVGSLEDFDRAVAMITSSDPTHASNLPARFLWQVRDLVGRRFGLGGISDTSHADTRLPIPGTSETTLADRLPHDLAASAGDVRFEHLPFVPLYRTPVELAAEVSNRTVHGVMHLAWAPHGEGAYQGRMAVYVKPRGAFGRAYMALIRPFRHLVVYPALERQLGKMWRAQPAGPRDTRDR